MMSIQNVGPIHELITYLFIIYIIVIIIVYYICLFDIF